MSTRAESAVSSVRDHLLRALADIPAPRRYWAAYSGGLDSTVLLHALAALRPRLSAAVRAVHVDHGLHPAASSWASHCRAAGASLGIEVLVRAVEVAAGGGEGPEAAARRARYDAFAGLMEPGDCLLTAHHRDDQAETVLLQLLRGSGPHGLAAMAAVDRFAAGLHARPFLDLDRDALRAYAEAAGLQWIRDPSNSDTRLRRNYLRHEIVPGLKRYWPALARTLSRSAAHAAAAAAILDETAAADLRAALGPQPYMLSADAVAALSRHRGDNLLRHWLHGLGLPLPSTAQLARARTDVLAARADAAPLLAWPGAEVRRYRGWLYAMAPLARPDPGAALQWAVAGGPLTLPGGGRLYAHPRRGAGLRAAGTLTVRFRRGGEHCRPAGSGHGRPVKKLLQEAAVPPWLRGHVPLIYIEDELAAVAGVCIAQGRQAAPDEEGWEIEWAPGPAIEA